MIIQPKNYTTQAIIDLTKSAEIFLAKGWIGSAEATIRAVQILKSAERFIIPDSSELFGMDITIGAEEFAEDLYHLPFMVTALEFEIDTTGKEPYTHSLNMKCGKRIALIAEYNEKVMPQFKHKESKGMFVIPLWLDESDEVVRMLGKGIWTMGYCGMWLPVDQTKFDKNDPKLIDEQVAATMTSNDTISDLTVRVVPILPEAALDIAAEDGPDE